MLQFNLLFILWLSGSFSTFIPHQPELNQQKDKAILASENSLGIDHQRQDNHDDSSNLEDWIDYYSRPKSKRKGIEGLELVKNAASKGKGKIRDKKLKLFDGMTDSVSSLQNDNLNVYPNSQKGLVLGETQKNGNSALIIPTIPLSVASEYIPNLDGAIGRLEKPYRGRIPSKLSEFMSLVKDELDGLTSKKNNRKKVMVEDQLVHLSESSSELPEPSSEAITQENQFIVRVCKPSGAPILAKEIKPLLYTLLRWVYFSCKTLIKTLKLRGYEWHYQKNLLFWIYHKISQPQVGPPIFGRLETLHQLVAGYDVVQKELIKYLTIVEYSKHPYHTAIFIVGKWYQEIHPMTWQQQWEGDETKFRAWFEYEVVQQALEKEKNRGNQNLDSKQEGKDLINQMAKLNEASHSQEGKDLINQMAKLNEASHSLLGIEEPVQKPTIEVNVGCMRNPHLRMFISQMKEDLAPFHVHQKTAIEKILNYPLKRFFDYSQVNGNWQLEYIIRITNQSDKILYKDELVISLKTLIRNLHFLHSALIKRLNMQNVGEYYQGALLYWFHSEFFTPKQSYPIYGKVIDGPHLANYQFGPVQIRLMKYFSEPITDQSSVDTAVVIIGIFYKNMFPSIWREIGNEDVKFWSELEIAVDEFGKLKPNDREKFENIHLFN